MNNDNNSAPRSACETLAIPQSLERLWEEVFQEASVIADVEEEIEDCLGFHFSRLSQQPDNRSIRRQRNPADLTSAASRVAALLPAQMASEAGYFHVDHLMALTRLLSVLEFVKIANRVPFDLADLRTVLAQESREQFGLRQVALAFAEIYSRNVLGQKDLRIEVEKLRGVFRQMQMDPDSLVGFAEALHRMGEKELAEVCFKRGQDASQPLAALATLRIAQYDECGSEHDLVRFMAAARGISVGWAIAGYGLLKEAIALLVIVASQIDAKTLNSFFEMLEGVDSLVKLSFPEGQYRFRLKAGVFTQEEIFNRTVDCLPMYQMQMVSLHSENWTDSSGLGNA
mgnify:FL=1